MLRHGKELYFDGKIGCWPFAVIQQAQRDSPNRPRGTWEWKTHKVKRDDIHNMLYEKVKPAILARFSQFPYVHDISIQWDNASTHFDATDPFWVLAQNYTEQMHGIRLHLINQPACSPDFNICDLSICNVLQCGQWKYGGHFHNIRDVITAVNHAWATFTHKQLEKAFCTLQTVFDAVIRVNGGNCYKLPHIGKDAIWNNYGVYTLCARAKQASQEACDLVKEVFGEE